MLPRAHRMVDPEDFRSTIRRGSRAGNAMVVVHCRTDEDSTERLVGFVVPKREIPRAVRRNRVRRQLRHLMRDRVEAMPEGARIVVRVHSAASGQDSDHLAGALDNALSRAWARSAPLHPTGSSAGGRSATPGLPRPPRAGEVSA